MQKLFSSLRSRLLLGSLIPLVLFLATALVCYLAIQSLMAAQRAERHSKRVLAKAYELKAKIATMESAKRGHHLLRDPQLRDPLIRQRFEEYWQEVRTDITQLRNDVAGDTSQAGRADEILRRAEDWHRQALSDFDTVEKDDFSADPIGIKEWARDAAIREMLGRAGEVIVPIDRLLRAEHDTHDARADALRDTFTRTNWAISLSLLGAVMLAVLVPLQLSRTITRPVERLSNALNQLRRGTFTTLAPSGPAEVAKLTSYFNMMGLALSEREALLRTAERRYQGLMGSVSNLLWTMDARGAFGNDFAGWLEFTGQREEDIKGEGWLQAVHADDRERVTRRLREALALKSAFEEECRIRRHEGDYRAFSCRCVPILDARQAVLEWVCACTDVTERKEEEQLRQEKDAAQAANRAKSEFLAKMSHELRTPLNAVIGMSKMLSTRRFGALSDKQADYLADITRAGEHLLALINDVLDLSKVESGYMQIMPEKVPLAGAVEELLSTVSALADSKCQSLHFERAEPAAEIVTDPARFKQVLFNLVSNAIKFTPEGGSVVVRARWAEAVKEEADPCPAEDAGAVRIDVEDTGIGIPAGEQASVWREFHQASNRELTVEGTGLGLPLTRRLVDLLGGVIWLRSTPGEGSRFSFALPLQISSADHRPSALDRKSDADGEKPKADGREPSADGRPPLALIVEDHVPTNKLLSDWLHDVGLETSSAFTGPEGLEQARRLRPDLILLDFRLPGLDGWQIMTELKGDPATAAIPVIVISVLDPQRLPGNLHVLDWFVKPLDRERFLRRLRADCPDLFALRRGLKALVVDDDPASRTLLADLLGAEGIEPAQAANGAEALRMLREAPPDLIVLDLLMPGTDGFAVAEAIRGDPRLRGIPILVVTAKDVTGEEWDRLNGTVQAFLAKGRLTPEKMSERLRGLGLTPVGMAKDE